MVPMGDKTAFDAGRLYETMVRIRRFEEEQAAMWREGLVSGELHQGIGEEAVVAGVVDHLGGNDAMALDHRSTPPLVARGVDLVSLFLEMLGSVEGICRGRGGHMHLFSPDHLAASSGIVGAAGPLACGFALAARRLRPGAVAVAFFGEGAANQGMLLEAFNLAVVWELPVVFVCKASRWAITTKSAAVTGGDLVRRARAFGLETQAASGTAVDSVWHAARHLLRRARKGRPGFLLARCHRPQGHFLGDPLHRMLEQPAGQAKEVGGPLLGALRRPRGAPARARAGGVAELTRRLGAVAAEISLPRRDPLERARRLVGADVAARIDERIGAEVSRAAAAARAGAGVPS